MGAVEQRFTTPRADRAADIEEDTHRSAPFSDQ
jgi:hypothetical protein